MTMTRKKKTKKSKDAFEYFSPLVAIHETTEGLCNAGVMDATTMREFDVLCLPEVKIFSSAQIKKIRFREKLSQAVFAKYLNTSTSTVRQWEIGDKHPRGTSLRLLNLVYDCTLLDLSFHLIQHQITFCA